MLYYVLYYIQQTTNIGKKMALTTEQIHQTAQELTEKGINPTLANVRSALGGGSFTTIGEALKTWKQAQKDNEKIKQVDIAPQIKDRADVLIGELWQNALDLADERLKLEREALAVAQQQADAKVAEMAEALAQVEAEQEQLNAQLDELTHSNENYKHLTKAQSDEISSLKQANAGLVATNQALQAQLDSLQAMFDKFLSKDNAPIGA
mgnify:FL=1